MFNPIKGRIQAAVKKALKSGAAPAVVTATITTTVLKEFIKRGRPKPKVDVTISTDGTLKIVVDNTIYQGLMKDVNAKLKEKNLDKVYEHWMKIAKKRNSKVKDPHEYANGVFKLFSQQVLKNARALGIPAPNMNMEYDSAGKFHVVLVNNKQMIASKE